uniref:Putative ovule protein n=1 Tax=Solanum chacoense TaxID=4108 RepID=A0A0V0H5H5_SOLCH
MSSPFCCSVCILCSGRSLQSLGLEKYLTCNSLMDVLHTFLGICYHVLSNMEQYCKQFCPEKHAWEQLV